MGKRYTGQGGSPTRRRRYSVQITFKVTEKARDDLQEMSDVTEEKLGYICRRAVMKDLYIWKAEQAKKAARLARNGDDDATTDTTGS